MAAKAVARGDENLTLKIEKVSNHLVPLASALFGGQLPACQSQK